MVARLVLDVVWRKRFAIGVAALQLYLSSKMILQIFPATDPMAPMLMAAWFLTIPAGPMLQSRELYQLPVSRRTWWITRWWLAAAGAVVIPVLTVFLVRWSLRSIRPEAGEIVLYAAWAFLYGGCAMALVRTRWGQWGDKPVVFQPRATPIPRDQIKPVNIKWLIASALLRVLPMYFVVMLIPPAAPFFVARYLPHTIAAIEARSIALALAMAAVSAWGYLYRPANEARPTQRMPRASTAAVAPVASSPGPPAATTPTRLSDRLTGLKLPLWEMSRKYLTTYASVLVVGIVWWWVASWYKAVPPLAVVLSRVDMLPFGSRVAHVTEPITVGGLFVITTFLDLGVVFSMRPLRALPISATRLSSIPILIGLVSTAMLWTTFLLFHLIVLRTMPVSFRLDLFTAYAALTAVSQTIRMTLPGNLAVKGMASVAPLMAVWLALGYTDTFRADIVQPAMLIGGLMAIATSFGLMRYVVTRSSRLYRPQLQPVRFGS